MRLDDYAEKTGKRVWLAIDELERLIDQTEGWMQQVALALGGKAGLRRSEITSVTPADFEHAPDGFVRVWSDYAKRDRYREAPIPDDFEQFVAGVATERPSDEPLVDVSGTTVYRWVRKAADRLEDETGDPGWGYLDVHDLRRSWGGHLLWNCGVSPMVVMEFGGWNDWQTFSEHYMGEMTPEAMERERAKIRFEESAPVETPVFEPATPGGV